MMLYCSPSSAHFFICQLPKCAKFWNLRECFKWLIVIAILANCSKIIILKRMLLFRITIFNLEHSFMNRFLLYRILFLFFAAAIWFKRQWLLFAKSEVTHIVHFLIEGLRHSLVITVSTANPYVFAGPGTLFIHLVFINHGLPTDALEFFRVSELIKIMDVLLFRGDLEVG